MEAPDRARHELDARADGDGGAHAEAVNLSRLPREEVLRAAREGDFSSLPRDGTHVVKP